MSRTRDFAGKFSFHLTGKMTPTEILKKGSDIIKFVFLSDCLLQDDGRKSGKGKVEPDGRGTGWKLAYR